MAESLEIGKMLTISTGHVSLDDVMFLQGVAVNRCMNDAETAAAECLSVYLKKDVGFFLYPLYRKIDDVETDLAPLKERSESLYSVVRLAYDNQCQLVCIDRDGPVVDGLNVYDW